MTKTSTKKIFSFSKPILALAIIPPRPVNPIVAIIPPTVAQEVATTRSPLVATTRAFTTFLGVILVSLLRKLIANNIKIVRNAALRGVALYIN